MVLHIYKTLSDASEFDGPTLKEVRVYETPDSWATVTA
jgi:hypothetical protein